MKKMKVLFLNAGNETGGGMHHILQMIPALESKYSDQFILGVFERKELYRRAKKQKINTVYFKNNTRWSPLLLMRIVTFIRTEKITHVHTHGPRANVYMYMIRKHVDVKWITTVHSHPNYDFLDDGKKGKLLTHLHAKSLKNAHHIISVCQAFVPSLQRLGIKNEKIHIIRNGIDFDSSLPMKKHEDAKLREEKGFQDNDFLLVMVARLEAVKGHVFAIESIAKFILRGHTNLHLLIVGSGSLKQSLNKLVRSLNVEENVHFYGNCRDVRPFYEAADIVLLTSKSESFPYVLLEAAREQKPVIATNVGDISELITKPIYGWLINYENKKELQKAIEQAWSLKKANMLPKMGQLFFSSASKKHTIEHSVNKLYDVYLQ